MNDRLKRKLRVRFVVLTMASLLLLQSIIVAVSIYNNYSDMVAKSDAILTQLSREASGNVRYFSVKVHPGKGSVRPDVVQHVTVTPEEAAAFAKNAMSTGQDVGFVGEYRYRILRSEEGVRILFLSRAQSLDMYRTAAQNLIFISLAGLLAVCAILIPVSGWIVEPLLVNQRKQKQFITVASHELKTPLTVISTDAQLLREEIGENPWIDGILDQVSHLTDMTHELVALAKAEELDAPAGREVFRLSEAVCEALEVYAGVAKQKSIDVRSTIPEGLTYTGNEKEIRRLLGILLDNAFKYCPEAGQIRVDLKKELRGVRLTVENTCAAISSEQLPSLKQRFFRGENAAGSKGFGLGLSIGESIAARHNGNLSVRLKKDDVFSVEVVLR